MGNHLRNTMIILMWLALAIPFVLQTDLYPFFRFGMFAEPVTRPIQTEQFLIKITQNDGVSKLLDSREIGFEKSTFDYLLRNYHYRGEKELFLQKISKTLSDTNNLYAIELLQIVEKDTGSVAAKYFYE
jgi:hypothetical protein